MKEKNQSSLIIFSTKNSKEKNAWMNEGENSSPYRKP
jgi:hypothetical protein